MALHHSRGRRVHAEAARSARAARTVNERSGGCGAASAPVSAPPSAEDPSEAPSEENQQEASPYADVDIAPPPYPPPPAELPQQQVAAAAPEQQADHAVSRVAVSAMPSVVQPTQRAATRAPPDAEAPVPVGAAAPVPVAAAPADVRQVVTMGAAGSTHQSRGCADAAPSLEPLHLRSLPGLGIRESAMVFRAAALVRLPLPSTDVSSFAAYTALWPYALVDGMVLPSNEVDLAKLSLAKLQQDLGEQGLLADFPWLEKRSASLGRANLRFRLHSVSDAEQAAKALVEETLSWTVGPRVIGTHQGCPLRIGDRVFGCCIAKDPSGSGRVVELQQDAPIELKFMLAGGAVVQLIDEHCLSASHAYDYSSSDIDVWMMPHILISPDGPLSDVLPRDPLNNDLYVHDVDHLPSRGCGWNVERALITVVPRENQRRKVDILHVPDPAVAVSCFDACAVRACFEITGIATSSGEISVTSCRLCVSPSFAVAFGLGIWSSRHGSAIHSPLHWPAISERSARRERRYLKRGFLSLPGRGVLETIANGEELSNSEPTRLNHFLAPNVPPIAFDEANWPLVLTVSFGMRDEDEPTRFHVGLPFQMAEGSMREIRIGLELADPQCHPLAFLHTDEGGIQPVELVYREYCSQDCPLLNPTVDDIHEGRVHWRDAARGPFSSDELSSLRHTGPHYSYAGHSTGCFVEIGGELVCKDKLWPACAVNLLQLDGVGLERALSSGRSCFSPYVSPHVMRHGQTPNLAATSAYWSEGHTIADTYLQEALASGIPVTPLDVARKVAVHSLHALEPIDPQVPKFYTLTHLFCGHLASRFCLPNNVESSWGCVGKHMRCRLLGDRISAVRACDHVALAPHPRAIHEGNAPGVEESHGSTSTQGESAHATTLSQGSNEEAVVQLIEHPDPAAQIGQEEAEQVIQAQHAGFVERRIYRSGQFGYGACASSTDDVEEALSEEGEKVFLLTLNRNPSPLREQLRDGNELRQCREALDAHGHKWSLPHGSLVFVNPCQYRAVMSALNALLLRPDHIVVSESLEYLVAEAIDACKCPKKVWCKSRRQLNVHGTWSEASTVSDTEATISSEARMSLEMLVIDRTFLCLAPVRLEACTVVQSTTEADSRKGMNPRRSLPSDGVGGD